MSNDDGHGPETCSYRECNAVSDVPCPFVRDDPKDYSYLDEPQENFKSRRIDRGKLQALAKRIREAEEEPEHEHQYTIPVEWEERTNISRNDVGQLRFAKGNNYIVVTEMRCVCGEETAR